MKLKRARERKNLTQQELADIIGTSCTNISHWESNTNVPQYKSIKILNAFFGEDFFNMQDFREE